MRRFFLIASLLAGWVSTEQEQIRPNFTEDADFLACYLYESGAEFEDGCQADGFADPILATFYDTIVTTPVPGHMYILNQAIEPSLCTGGPPCENIGWNLDEDAEDPGKFDFRNGDFCIGGWYRFSDANTGLTSRMIRKFGGYALKKKVDDRVAIEIDNGNEAETEDPLLMDTWYHLVGCYTESDGGTELYLNGDSDGTDSGAAQVPITTTNIQLCSEVGGDDGGAGSDEGYCAEEFFVNRRLEDAEVCCLCRYGLKGDWTRAEPAECSGSCSSSVFPEQRKADGTLVCR